MGHESITELFEERFADAVREEESLPTPVASALRTQTGAAIDDFALAALKQRSAECAAGGLRRATLRSCATATTRNGRC